MVLGTLLCSVMISCEKENTDFSVKVMERPVTTEVSVNYTGNRAPLKPLNFIKLPVGDIQPKGWLKKYLLLQKEGLTGRLGEISAWLEKENNAWLMSGGQSWMGGSSVLVERIWKSGLYIKRFRHDCRNESLD